MERKEEKKVINKHKASKKQNQKERRMRGCGVWRGGVVEDRERRQIKERRKESDGQTERKKRRQKKRKEEMRVKWSKRKR